MDDNRNRRLPAKNENPLVNNRPDVVVTPKPDSLQMCFIVVGTFVAVWTPYALVCSLHIFHKELPLIITALPTMCAKSSCMMNPFIYFFTNGNFRQRFLEMIGCIMKDDFNRPSKKETILRYDRTTREGVYIGQHSVKIDQETVF